MANPIKLEEFFDPNLGAGAQLLSELTASIQGLKRNYTAFAKGLEADSERVKTALAGIGPQAGQLATQIGGLNMASEQERVIFAALNAQIISLAAEQKRLQDVLAAQATAQKTVNDATKQAQTATRALQNELREAYKAQDTERIEQAATALRSAKTETTALSAALRGTNSELSAARGSYDALDAENKRLIVTLKSLGDGLGGNEEKVAALQNQIAQNTTKLKEFDERILVFGRNVGNYAGSFSQLVAELAKARAAQEGMSQGTAAYAQQQTKIIGFQMAAQKSAASMGLSYEQAEAKINGAGAALRPLATNLVQLEREQLNLATSTGAESEEYRKLGFQIQAAKKQLDEVAVSTTATEGKQSNLTQQLGFTREGLTQYAVGLAASTVGVGALVQDSQTLFQSNVEYSRELAEVRKTTGLTADEADRLADSLKKLDTPTSLQGLLKIAAVGGQLGKNGVEDVLAFTQAVDTAVQALSNDFGNDAELIATDLGKISNVFRKELGPDEAQNILAIGSAINQLGAVGAATAPFLADVALRTGAISASTGVGLKNTLAYAAVLQETGSTAEVAGTSLNRLYSTLTTRTKQAYDIARLANPALTLKEYTHLVNTDFNQAIQVFLKGLNEGGKSTTEQAALLKTLKLQSGEARAAIVTLAQNLDLYSERQQTANDQLRDATSLAAEAAINTDTLAGSVDKLTNDTKNFFTSGAAGGFLKWVVDATHTLYSSTIGDDLRAIGDGLTYVKEKLGLSKPPLDDYTVGVVTNTLALRKQVDAQQQLLKSYTELAGTSRRTAAQELELSRTRAQLQQQFGTVEVTTIQAGIDKRREAAALNKASLENDLSLFDKNVASAQQQAAQAQEALNSQAARLDAAQLARVREIATARLDDSQPVRGKSSNPELEPAIAAATRLTQAERELTEQQRVRANIQAALAKLGDGATKQKLAEADATEAEVGAEAQLDRTAQERAKNRVAALQDELAANQKRIADARAYQVEQGKLFTDRQISAQVLAENVAGSEDLISQAERRGAAIRIQLARAESSEKLTAAENDRIRQSQQKNITQAELTDIDGQYSARRVEIFRKEKVAIGKIYDELADKLAVKPLEFKLPSLDANTLKPVTDNLTNGVKNAEEALQSALNGIKGDERTLLDELEQARAAGIVGEFGHEERLLAIKKDASDKTLALLTKAHKATGDEESNANALSVARTDLATKKRLAIISQAGEYAQQLEGAFYSIKGNLIDAQIQRTQTAYDNEVKAAGNNAELKAQIDKKYQKQLAKLNYDKARAEKDAAEASILISTAVGIAKAFAEYVFPYALIPAGIAAAQGALQFAVVASKPLPAYFRGRKDGPAEQAIVGDRGPELYGQASTGYQLATRPTVVQLRQHDVVYTAPETRDILAQSSLVEERIHYRTQQADLARSTVRLQRGAAQQAAAALQLQQADTQALLHKLDRVERAIKEQEYNRLNEQGDLVRRIEADRVRRDSYNKRYRPNG